MNKGTAVITGGVIGPTDLVGVVSFLCSADSAFITGQTIIADGGQARI